MKNRNQIHIFIRLHLMFKKFTQALCEYNSTLFSAVRCKKILKKQAQRLFSQGTLEVAGGNGRQQGSQGHEDTRTQGHKVMRMNFETPC